MLNHTLFKVLRPASPFFAPSQLLATRRVGYENKRFHKKEYKSFARDRRKAVKRANLTNAIITPRDIGEEQLPFFTPMRNKLYFKCIQDIRNNNRFVRKPIPQELKLEYARRSKEYTHYKIAERALIHQELNQILDCQEKAFEACLFLPDYLMEESFEETGQSRSGELEEYSSAKLYMEQLLRILPREFTCRLKLLPAFEETFMKIDEARGGSGGRQSTGAANSSANSPAI